MEKKYVLNLSFTTEIEGEDAPEAFIKATSGLRYYFPNLANLIISTVREILPPEVPTQAEAS